VEGTHGAECIRVGMRRSHGAKVAIMEPPMQTAAGPLELEGGRSRAVLGLNGARDGNRKFPLLSDSFLACRCCSVFNAW
jgi:hypothetical protein